MSTENPGGRLDLWSFIDLARQRLAEDVEGVDVQSTELLLRLNRASSLVTYDLEAGVHRPRGRSWATFRIMYVLWLAGQLESHRIASVAGMSRAAVSNLVGPLVEQGVLVRRPHPEDGRAVLLSLSEAGEAETREAYVRQNAREREWTAALSPAEQRQLSDLLAKLVEGRDEIAPASRP